MITEAYIDDFQIHGSAATWLTELQGLGSPPPRSVVSTRATRHGAVDHTRYYDGRLLDLVGFIPVQGDPEAAYATLDEIKQKFSLGANRTFRFRREGLSEDEQIVGRIADVLSVEIQRSHIRYGVAFFSPDPRIFSSGLRSASYDPTGLASTGGIDMPIDFPLEFSTSTAATLQVTNGGNYPTPPLMLIEGPVTNPILANHSLAGPPTLRISYSLGASDYVFIDVTQRTVTLNNVPRLDLLDASGSTWWELQPGTNVLQMSGSGMTAAATSFSIYYYDAWI